MGRIDKLVERYKGYISLPWQNDLAGAQRIIFVVYDKTDERRLRMRKVRFEMATNEAGHGWVECDLTCVFAKWMAATEYKESYFESPEDIEIKLEDDFLEHVAEYVSGVLASPAADENSVVGIFGIASLFGFVRVSDLMKSIERHIEGRVVVFFPGEYENSNYRLLDARDGWNYLAVPITVHEDQGVYEA
ncbi:MAG: DUF1788 domain-containing protein [Ectothiorhodospiraceae bacterium AqS1]|nr:DUF1788 domain-containing protein [Ectothiorhodospiraceae bacterium AqS1]